MRSVHGTLTIRVVYDPSAYEKFPEVEADVHKLLSRIAVEAAGHGLLSGETPLSIDAWEYEVEVEEVR